MHEMISELLVTEREVLGVERVIRALESKNLPAENHHVLWLLEGSTQHPVFPHEGAEEMEIVLVSREERPTSHFEYLSLLTDL